MNRVFDAYASYYDLLYKDKDYVGEAAYVAKLLGQQHADKGGTILELGSGTGKHAMHLAHMGYSVHGVDMSEKMVEAAEQRKPIDLVHRLKFEVGDVRTVRVQKLFDAVISLFHVASYQTTNEDLLAMFQTAATHLKPGGVFIFDFWYGPGVLSDPPVVRIKRMKSEEIDVLRIAEPEPRCNDNVVEVNYTIMVTRRVSGEAVNFTEKHSMRYLFIPEISYLLKDVGLILKESYAWLGFDALGHRDWLGVVSAIKV